MFIFTLLAQALPSLQIDTRGLPVIPFGELLTFIVRAMFIIAGLAALMFGLLGGIAWIMSGGAKEDVQAARDKIQAAIIGVFVLILVLTMIWTLENVIFQRNICFGLSCPVTIPQLNITPLPSTQGQSGTNTNTSTLGGTTRTTTTTTTTQQTGYTTISATPTTRQQQLPATGGH